MPPVYPGEAVSFQIFLHATQPTDTLTLFLPLVDQIDIKGERNRYDVKTKLSKFLSVPGVTIFVAKRSTTILSGGTETNGNT